MLGTHQMANLPRQEIQELLTKYELHPELIDVYVEGDFDKDLIDGFLDATNLRVMVSVHAIDGIEVPDHLVAGLGLTAGSNKHRLIALASALAQLPAAVRGVSCVIDADLDRVCESLATQERLRYTDYTCMEMYGLNTDVVRRFVTFVCNLSDKHANDFMALAAAILPVQFAARAAVALLDLGASVPDASAGFRRKRDYTSFDTDIYFEQFIQAGRLAGRRDETRVLFDDIRGRLAEDLRHKAHGHDFIALLFSFSWAHDALKLHSKTEDVLRFGARLLCSGVDFASLASESLFAAIATSAEAVGG
jgi:hypothetical protein